MNRLQVEKSDEYVPEWDVHRDQFGDPIIIDFDCQYLTESTLPRPLTDDEITAIRRAVDVHALVCIAMNDCQHEDARRGGTFSWLTPAARKSRLLGRMIHEGRPPTRSKPPVVAAEPRWDLLPGGDPFADGETDGV